MNLYNPVSLPFSDILIRHTLEQTNDLSSDRIYIKNIIIPEDERKTINQYLNNQNVSSLLNILAFKRKIPYVNYRTTHIDYAKENPIKCSVVIPVAGFKNTGQVWYDGNYNILLKVETGYEYTKIDWITPGTEIGRAEITSPTLVRTDIPHGVFSNKLEYRTTCTIRFKDNEDFDYLAKHLSY
jgi:hypothetical protein